MSRSYRSDITCPACGTNGEIILWESLNNVLNPDEAQQLIDGSLFKYHCPHCGIETDVFYPCLYHDMKGHAMVQLVDESSIKQAIDMLDRLQSDVMFRKMTTEANYQHRVVTSQNSLREKALIFRDGRDDRVLEILKLLVLKQLAHTEAEFEALANDAELFYLCQTPAGKLELALFIVQKDGSWSKPQTVEVPQDLYAQANQIVDRRSRRIESTYIIDQNWASHILLAIEDGD